MNSQSRSKSEPDNYSRRGTKEALRDKKGRPYYLSRLPFYRKYPRFFIITGASICALLPFSRTLYDFLFRTPEDIKGIDRADWWPSEKRAGKRIVDMHRERWEAQRKEKEERLAAAAAAKN